MRGHWDNLAPKVASDSFGHAQIGGHDSLEGLDGTEDGREVIEAFLHDVVQSKASGKTPSCLSVTRTSGMTSTLRRRSRPSGTEACHVPMRARVRNVRWTQTLALRLMIGW